jgi:signal transduction histidine kinase
MDVGGLPPDPEPPAHASVLRDGGRARLTRLFLPGRTVIRKEPLGTDAPDRLRNEIAMLRRLGDVVGVVPLLEEPRYPGSIVLADVGGTNLAELATPLDVDELIRVAVRLARAVAGMHRGGVLHRDITPANVVLSDDGAPCLVDFASATSFGELRPEFTHHTQISGTPAYLAPEQTGRTGRAVDQRADLYALGTVLYELATGAPPFGSGDPLRLVHDHLARVPVPPAEVTPGGPALLSVIVMRLLEKEPDNRYQTADGLLYDLERLWDAEGRSAAAALTVGERDFPARLLAPSRLVGRESEVAELREALEEALAGRCQGVVVGEAPGVGKTALVDELRAVVTGRDGWYVAGKFDQYRRDLEFNAVHLVFRALGRLLLAEPEDEMERLRERILRAVGPNAGLQSAAIPELAALLGAPPEPGDPLTAAVRAQRSGVAALRAVASRKRPLVVFVDDLQWAGRTALGFVDLVLSEGPIEGLLLVVAYREEEVNGGHQLAEPLARWRDLAGVRFIRLDNLPVASLAAMVGEMLRVEPDAAAGLAELIEPCTSGNPYETVELLNALRRDGLLVATAEGWRWDQAAVAVHLARSDVATLVAARVTAVPPASRQVLEGMACLGGRAEASLLRTALGESAGAVDVALAAALHEGLLVVEPGAREAVRFRHDRIREAILAGLEPSRRRTLQLTMARRLAGVPALFAVAAEQYLPVVDAVEDPEERARVVRLLRRAADQARLTGDHGLVNALLTAALRLIDPNRTESLLEVHTGRHTALFSMGRLDEADEEYRTITRLCPSALGRAATTCVQVRSLAHRNRYSEALELGLDSLRELGITVPATDRLAAELSHQFDRLYRWLDDTDVAADVARPESADPVLLALSGLAEAVLPVSFFVADLETFAWLSLEALRIGIEHGSTRTLLGPAGHAAVAAVALRGDQAAAHRAVRLALALGEAGGYEPETSQARFRFACFGWSAVPIEDIVLAARRAREELIAAGDLGYAGYTGFVAVAGLLDCAPSLEGCAAEVDAALAFARRTGSEQIGQWLDSYCWLAGVLRGEIPAGAGHGVLTDTSINPLALLLVHITRGIAAAVLGDPDNLARHTAAAMPLEAFAAGLYPSAAVRLLRGLALAVQARHSAGDARAGALAELDEVTRWLAARAVDAPANFLHLVRLLEAERAWAVGDFRGAVLAFDAARREVAGRRRPWHRALITERAARFHLVHGIEQAGFDLLALARQDYQDWGASAKVAQLDWAYPSLRPRADAGADGDPVDLPADPAPSRTAVTTGTLDLVGIVSASQALSSETSIAGLRSRVAGVLGAMTGATGVHLLSWSEDQRDWLLPAPGGGASTIVAAGHELEVPTTVLRYVRRTGEPLVVFDATCDDRFARDPYFADVERCSVLALPILSRGTPSAVLLLENRLLRGAFTAERLDAVKLIAGQLAVSLDNARLYGELTTSRARLVAAADQARQRIERDLHDGAQQRLVSLALRLRAAQAGAPPDSGELAGELDSLVSEATSALDELRELARGIHPAVLVEGGLRAALEALALRAAVPVELDVEVEGRLPEQVEIAAYYVVSEALTNAAKHAEASVFEIRVEGRDDVLRVGVRDDGRGGATMSRGTGLLGLKDRVEALGGRLVLDSPAGAGTTLRLELPLTATNDEAARG